MKKMVGWQDPKKTMPKRLERVLMVVKYPCEDGDGWFYHVGCVYDKDFPLPDDMSVIAWHELPEPPGWVQGR